MSDIGSLGTGIPTSAVPAEVKKAGEKATDTYKAALGFEQMLVKQLTKQLSDSSALGGDGGDSGSNSDDDSSSGAGSSPAAYRDMVSDQMAASITNAGGLGIAKNLYETLMAQNGTDATSGAGAGTAANGATTTDSGTGVTGANDATSGGLLS
jgi:Rod binding domain-containing protein